MTCPKNAADLAMRRASGTLDIAEQDEFEQHLRECESCRALAVAQQHVWAALGAWKAPAVSDDFDRQLRARIAAEEAAPWWHRFAFLHPLHNVAWRPAVAVALGCVAVLAILLLQGPLLERSLTPVAQQKSVDIDQVESALDDVDMLNQLGGAVPAPKGQPGS